MLVRSVEGGFIVEFEVEGGNREALTVSHLMLANDTFLFCDVLSSNVLSIRAMILCFEAIMGLVINLLQNIDWPHYWIVKWDLYRMNYLAM